MRTPRKLFDRIGCPPLPFFFYAMTGHQAPVVQKLNITIYRINHYLVKSIRENQLPIQWTVIYPVDSVIHLLSNWGQKNAVLGENANYRRIVINPANQKGFWGYLK